MRFNTLRIDEIKQKRHLLDDFDKAVTMTMQFIDIDLAKKDFQNRKFVLTLDEKQMADLSDALRGWRDHCENKLNYRLESFDSNPKSSVNSGLKSDKDKAERLLRMVDFLRFGE